MEWDYEAIKDEARRRGCKVNAFLAMGNERNHPILNAPEIHDADRTPAWALEGWMLSETPELPPLAIKPILRLLGNGPSREAEVPGRGMGGEDHNASSAAAAGAERDYLDQIAVYKEHKAKERE